MLIPRINTDIEQDIDEIVDPNLDQSFDEEQLREYDQSEIQCQEVFSREKRMSCVAHTLMLVVQVVSALFMNINNCCLIIKLNTN